jgi:hypothetical protein
MCLIASSRGRMPAIAKKHVCMIVLMREPMPALFARSYASIAKNRIFFSMICSCSSRGS